MITDFYKTVTQNFQIYAHQSLPNQLVCFSCPQDSCLLRTTNYSNPWCGMSTVCVSNQIKRVVPPCTRKGVRELYNGLNSVLVNCKYYKDTCSCMLEEQSGQCQYANIVYLMHVIITIFIYVVGLLVIHSKKKIMEYPSSLSLPRWSNYLRLYQSKLGS